MDYRIRGFTRDVNGKKHFVDHNITSIQDYIAEDTQRNYQMIDVNVYQENIFHTKMILNDFVLDNYLFEKQSVFSEQQQNYIEKQLKKEMLEIFYGGNYATE